MKEIKLTKGKVTIVDDEDYPTLAQKKWYAHHGRCNIWYAMRQTTVDGKRVGVFMHREITKCAKGMEVDHIDHNSLNNRRNNLRIVTHSENMHNSLPKSSSSGFRGVSKCGNKWQALGYKRGSGEKVKYLGLFSTARLAASAVKKYRENGT